MEPRFADHAAILISPPITPPFPFSASPVYASVAIITPRRGWGGGREEEEAAALSGYRQAPDTYSANTRAKLHAGALVI